MRARSEEEKKLEKWANHFPALTDRQKKYAVKHCFDSDNYVYLHRKWAYCPSTGKVWKANVDKETQYVCSLYTNEKKLFAIRRKSDSTRRYFCILTTKGGYQVCRWFLIIRYVSINWGKVVSHNVDYSYWPVACEFLSADGTVRSYEKSRWAFSSWQTDNWKYYEDMSLKRESFFTKNIANSGCLVTSVLPIVRRNGWTNKHKYIGLEYIDMVALLKYPQYEQLYKYGHYAVCRQFVRNNIYYLCCNRKVQPSKFWSKLLIKLANRHHVRFDTDEKWNDMQDYYNDLEYLHKDIHNPSILFPTDFQSEHMRIHHIVQKKREEEERRRIEEYHYEEMRRKNRENEEVKKWVAEYTRRFEDMNIKIGDFDIKPLITMDDFKAEADEMHHCIVTYYGKRNTLLLSIEHDGKKCETAEVSLIAGGHLVQCKGHCNHPSEYHDEIVGYLNDNMKEFLKRANRKLKTNVVSLPVPVNYYQTKYKLAV